MVKASNILSQAKAWIGKKESDGSFKVIIDKYNGHKPLARGYAVKYTDEWCATFISAVAIACGATDIIPTECSCQKMIEAFKKIGCWVEDENRTPSAGEIIFYDWQDSGIGDNQGWSDHVGYVECVVGNVITVIEGNYSGEVKRRKISVNSRYIRGYATPKYDAEETKITTTATTTSISKGKAINLNATPIYKNATTSAVSASKTGTYYIWSEEIINKRVRITNTANKVGKAGQVTGWVNVSDIAIKKNIIIVAKEVIAGMWGNGNERKQKLEAAGYDHEEVQQMVNTLM